MVYWWRTETMSFSLYVSWLSEQPGRKIVTSLWLFPTVGWGGRLPFFHQIVSSQDIPMNLTLSPFFIRTLFVRYHTLSYTHRFIHHTPSQVPLNTGLMVCVRRLLFSWQVLIINTCYATNSGTAPSTSGPTCTRSPTTTTWTCPTRQMTTTTSTTTQCAGPGVCEISATGGERPIG